MNALRAGGTPYTGRVRLGSLLPLLGVRGAPIQKVGAGVADEMRSIARGSLGRPTGSRPCSRVRFPHAAQGAKGSPEGPAHGAVRSCVGADMLLCHGGGLVLSASERATLCAGLARATQALLIRRYQFMALKARFRSLPLRAESEGSTHMDAVRDIPPACAARGDLGVKKRGMRPHAHLAHLAAIVLTVAMFGLLAGCATGGTTSSPNVDKLCQRLVAVNQSLAQLATIGDNTTVGEVKARQQQLSKALDALGKVPVGSGDTLDQLKSANNQLAEKIKDLPDSATVGEVGPRLQDFQSTVSKAQAAATKLSSTLRCS